MERVVKSVDINTSEVALVNLAPRDDKGKGSFKDKEIMIGSAVDNSEKAEKEKTQFSKKMLFSVDPLNVVNDHNAVEKLIDIRRAEFIDPQYEQLYRDFVRKSDTKQRAVVMLLAAIFTVRYLATLGDQSLILIVTNTIQLFVTLVGGVFFLASYYNDKIRSIIETNGEFLIKIAATIFICAKLIYAGLEPLFGYVPTFYFSSASFFIAACGISLKIPVRFYRNMLLPAILLCWMPSMAVASNWPSFYICAGLAVASELKSLVFASLIMYRIEVSRRLAFFEYLKTHENMNIPDANKKQQTTAVSNYIVRAFYWFKSYNWYIRTDAKFDRFMYRKMESGSATAILLSLVIDTVVSTISFYSIPKTLYWVLAFKMSALIGATILLLIVYLVFPRIKCLPSLANPKRIPIMCSIAMLIDSAAFLFEFNALTSGMPLSNRLYLITRINSLVTSLCANSITIANGGIRFALFMLFNILNLAGIIIIQQKFKNFLGMQVDIPANEFQDGDSIFEEGIVLLVFCFIVGAFSIRTIVKMWNHMYKSEEGRSANNEV